MKINMLKIHFSHFYSKPLFINDNLFPFRLGIELDEYNDKDDRKRPSLPKPALNIHSPTTSKAVTCIIYYLTVASKNFKRRSIRVISKKADFKATAVL